MQYAIDVHQPQAPDPSVRHLRPPLCFSPFIFCLTINFSTQWFLNFICKMLYLLSRFSTQAYILVCHFDCKRYRQSLFVESPVFLFFPFYFCFSIVFLPAVLYAVCMFFTILYFPTTLPIRKSQQKRASINTFLSQTHLHFGIYSSCYCVCTQADTDRT